MTATLALLAEGTVRTTFSWGRIQSNTDWILPIGAAILVMLLVRMMYRRDAEELRPWVGWTLTALRTLVFLVLLVLYCQPQWRNEREEVHNSRVVLAVDTSLSMGLSDGEGGGSASSTRAQQVAQALGQSDLLEQLRRVHDVAVMRFDEKSQRVASLGKLPAGTGGADAAAEDGGTKVETPAKETLDWQELLKPVGTETRLGQALRQLVYDERNEPVAGIVVMSDGGQNAGSSPEAAVELAHEAKIPIYTVGIGSRHRPVNVRVYELQCPERTHPGDPYTVTGLIQSQGMAGKHVNVEVLVRSTGRGEPSTPGTGTPAGKEGVVLGSDGEVVPVKFQLTPTSPGRQTVCLRVEAPPGDHDPKDNFREADVEVVDRKNRVLLFAGGPTREYQYVRTLLFRDASTTVDVLLQSAPSGIAQEANTILSEFPSTREAMYAYDCVVAFDPDWKMLSAGQIDLLEQWVAEQGGGLIAVAGPVYAGRGDQRLGAGPKRVDGEDQGVVSGAVSHASFR